MHLASPTKPRGPLASRLMGARALVRKLLEGTPYKSAHWIRNAEVDAIRRFLSQLPTDTMDLVEVSGTQWRHEATWQSWTELDYPEFDLTAPDHERRYDVVICCHVLEHVADPWRAARTLEDLCRPGGWLIVVTPFLIKIHRTPADYWRFTPDGLARLFDGMEIVELGSWGNAWAVAANLRIFIAERRWVRWLDRWTMRNNPATPTSVWVIARRPEGDHPGGDRNC